MCSANMDAIETGALQVSAGYYHTCVLKTNGTVSCSGANIPYTNLDGYDQLNVPAGLSNVIQVSS